MIIKQKNPNSVLFKANSNVKNIQNISAKTQGDSLSFGGVESIFNTFSMLEAKPILSLLTINLFGMLIPRTLTELNRNKKELGHLNWNAGRERLIDEVTSTFTLFFAPGMLFNYVGQKLLNSKFNPMGVNTKSFTDYKMLDVINNKVKDVLLSAQLNGNTKMSVNELRKAVAEGLLNDTTSAYGKLKLSPELIKEVVEEVGSSMQRANVDKLVKRFVRDNTKKEFLEAFKTAKEQVLKEAMEKGITDPSKSAVGKEAYKRAMEAIKDLVSKNKEIAQKTFMADRDKGIAKFIEQFVPKAAKNLQETDVAIATKGAKPLGTQINLLIRDIFSATDDIVMKAAKGQKEVNVSEMAKNTNNIMQSLKNLKLGKVVLPFGIVLGLLMLFPKLNIWLTQKITGTKEFPGLAGLGDSPTTDKNKKGQATNTPTPTTPDLIPTNYGTPGQIGSIPVGIPVSLPGIPSAKNSQEPVINKSVFSDFERRMQV